MRRRTGRAQTPLFDFGWTAGSVAWNRRPTRLRPAEAMRGLTGWQVGNRPRLITYTVMSSAEFRHAFASHKSAEGRDFLFMSVQAHGDCVGRNPECRS